jgi:twitching motility protein PilT
MIELIKRTAPLVARWLQSVENDPSIDRVYLSMLQDLEANPDLSKTLVLAKDMVATRELRLVAMAALLAGRFDHARAQAFLEVLLGNPDARLRMVALEAANIGGTTWGLRKCVNSLVDRDQAVRDRALEIYRAWDAGQVKLLFDQLLERGDTASLTDAAEGLARIADRSFLDAIERTFNRVDITLKRKLARALVKMKDPDVLEWARAFHARTTDPDGRKILELTLGEMGAPPKTASPLAGPPDAAPPAPRPGVTPASLPGMLLAPVLAGPGGGAEAAVRIVPVELPDPDQAATAGGQAWRPVPVGMVAFTEADRERIHGMLRELLTQAGSDLHVKAGLAARIRREGHVVSLPGQPLTESELVSGFAAVTPPRLMQRYMDEGDLNLSIGVAGAGRFRLNFFRSRGMPGMVARVIPNDVPSLAELDAPPLVGTLAQESRGLLLVTGPTGSGKSTLVAAMLDLINSTRHGHIITLEDPLEFIHRDKQCTVTQREVGTDVRSFAEGIRFAQRMDPDVILVGELSHPDTIRAAFQAAAGGRLVLATLHTSAAAKSVERVVTSFPPDEQAQARTMLAQALVGIVCQTLVSLVKGGRAAVHEVMLATPAIRKAIRENQPNAIYAQIESGSSQGMVTLEQSLARLYKQGRLTRQEAASRASDPLLFAQLL